MILPLEKQVVGRELSKQLKEARYKQDGLWWWVDDGTKYHRYKLSANSTSIDIDGLVIIGFSAPTVAELGERLPINFTTKKVEYSNKEILFRVMASIDVENMRVSDCKTEADARANVWLYLKKNKPLEKNNG